MSKYVVYINSFPSTTEEQFELKAKELEAKMRNTGWLCPIDKAMFFLSTNETQIVVVESE